jgi:hypothetical protein
MEFAIAELSEKLGRTSELLLPVSLFSCLFPHFAVWDVSVEAPFLGPSFQLSYPVMPRVSE